MPPEIEPNHISQQRASGRSDERADGIHLSRTCQGSRCQKPWCRRERKAHLLDEDHEEQNEWPMPREEVERFIHEPSLVAAESFLRLHVGLDKPKQFVHAARDLC